MTTNQAMKKRGFVYAVYIEEQPPVYTVSLFKIAALVIENRGKEIDVVRL